MFQFLNLGEKHFAVAGSVFFFVFVHITRYRHVLLWSTVIFSLLKTKHETQQLALRLLLQTKNTEFPNQLTNLKVLLCCVNRSTGFKPGYAGRRDATGDAIQTDGLVENH